MTDLECFGYRVPPTKGDWGSIPESALAQALRNGGKVRLVLAVDLGDEKPPTVAKVRAEDIGCSITLEAPLAWDEFSAIFLAKACLEAVAAVYQEHAGGNRG